MGTGNRAGTEWKAAWWLLAACLAISMVGAHPLLLTVSVLALAVSGAFVFHPVLQRTVRERWPRLLDEPLSRFGLLVLATLHGVVLWLFSPSAMLLLLACVSAVLLERLARSGVRSCRVLMLGFVATGLTLCLLLGGAELALRTETLEHRFGLPAEWKRWERRYDRLERHNVFGFRSPYEQVAKEPGTYRVVALGDSFTWGQFVADSDELWPSRLEVALQAAAGDRRVEVINMAREGFTTGQEAERLRRVGWQFDPDLVIVQFLANDPIESFADFEIDLKLRDGWLYPRYAVLPLRFRTGAVRDSALLAFADRAYGTWRGNPIVPRYLALFADDAPGWIQTQARFREMAEAGRERGVPVLLVLFPMLEPGAWTVESYPLAPAYAKAEAAAREAGLEVIDLTPDFAAPGGDWRRWWATPFDAHPGPEAQAVAGERIAAYVLDGAGPNLSRMRERGDGGF